MSGMILPPGAGEPGLLLPPGTEAAQDGPPDIDLTKPVSEEDFKRGLLMVLSNIAGELAVQNEILDKTAKISYDATAMRHQGLNLAKEVVAQLETVGILEREEAPATNDQDLSALGVSNNKVDDPRRSE